MKYCVQCGAMNPDHALFCNNCGFATAKNGQQNAGGFNNSYYSPPTNQAYSPYANPYGAHPMVSVLCRRLRINGIIWIVIASLQILIGLCGALTVLIVGVLNIISAIYDIKNSNAFMQSPVGIINTFKPCAGAVVTLIYNLIIGGLIGAIGSFYYFFAIRNYVVSNEAVFFSIEQEALK